MAATSTHIASDGRALTALATLRPPSSGQEPAPGLAASWRGRPVVITAVLERTAVVYEPPDGERQVANKRDLLVDASDVRWQAPAIPRANSWQREGPRVVQPAAAASVEPATAAVDKPADQPRPRPVEKRRRRTRAGANTDSELLEQLPPELRDLVVHAVRALVRARAAEEELQRHLAVERHLLRSIRRRLSDSNRALAAGCGAGEEQT